MLTQTLDNDSSMVSLLTGAPLLHANQSSPGEASADGCPRVWPTFLFDN